MPVNILVFQTCPHFRSDQSRAQQAGPSAVLLIHPFIHFKKWLWSSYHQRVTVITTRNQTDNVPESKETRGDMEIRLSNKGISKIISGSGVL